jgi:4-amino-4-deoxy-L-arabinose transferase-like glycosyltransferase
MRAREAALVLLISSGLALFVSGLYGIASPFVAGHYGYHGGEYSTRARNTMRHGSILPVNVPTFYPPKPEQYYLHHPVLTHQLVTLTMTLLGDHEYSVRAAGLLACFACFLLLARLIWVHWGPLQAALAAATFVIVPINVWFANHIDVGYPSIAALLAFFACYLRWLQVERWRYAAGALFFAALAGFFEWSPYLAAVPIFLHALWTGMARRGRFLRFVPLYALAVVLPLAVHALIVWKTGHVAEMVESYGVRTAGGLNQDFYRLSYEHGVAMFGEPLLVAGGLWLLLLIGRLVSGRARARDLIGVSFTFALLLYIHIFRQGVLIHAYRYLYGGIVCAIAVCDLTETLSGAASSRVRRPIGTFAVRATVAVGVVGAILGSTFRPARSAWLESRLKGGSPFLVPYNPETAKIPFAVSGL